MGEARVESWLSPKALELRAPDPQWLARVVTALEERGSTVAPLCWGEAPVLQLQIAKWFAIARCGARAVAARMDVGERQWMKAACSSSKSGPS